MYKLNMNFNVDDIRAYQITATAESKSSLVF